MNKLITLLAEIEQISSTSNPVIHDLSIQALDRAKHILKTVTPTNYENSFDSIIDAFRKYSIFTADK